MRSLPLLLVLYSFTAFSMPETRKDFQWAPLERIAIQERGRIKPLDTFARESVQFLTGKQTWKGMGSLEVLFSFLFKYEEWESEEFIRIDYGPLKEALGLNSSQKYFTPKALGENTELVKLVRIAVQKEQKKERLSEVEKKAIQVQNQRGVLDSLVSGTGMSIFPNPKGGAEAWMSLQSLSERNLPYPPDKSEKIATLMRNLIESYMKSDAKLWNGTVLDFTSTLRNDLAPAQYPSFGSLDREVHYNQLRPFRWAWILYLVAFLALLAAIVTQNKRFEWVGAGGLLAAFGIHVYGFVIRCLIAGRPPVSNMYESVIWVTFGCVLFSLLIWLAYRKTAIPAAASVFAIVGLVLADNVPTVLDPSIHPLEPVLRSNFWLTIHVLTITLSYAAFALSLCIGNVVLGAYLFRPGKIPFIQNFTLYMYRAMQIGVILLAAGTILGGVWADYSWGRFWGWDPKEVWALIALLLYIAVLHGRFAGWLKGFGFVTATVMSFLGVLMAWYGVNFVLGVGLHSYGFGSGGMVYVLGYLTVQLLFIFAAYQKYSISKKTTGEVAIFPKG